MNSNSIQIFQKNWAFTSADAQKTQITTGSFGPCYVVTFASKGFAAMAHIDDNTEVKSMKVIFNKFLENSVELKNVKVIILGGWKDFPESFKWGKKVVKRINKAGFETVSTKNMYSKKTLTVFQEMIGITPAEVPNHYHFGALIDAKTGKTFLMKERKLGLDEEQDARVKQFIGEYGPDAVVPLSQIV
ncbi:MAG: hypothetical protein CK425_00920 [Parachlamydia sp.]|nr:MAG: hypothetical protein CK425_00920 [Parachlamydia sp.]